MRLLENKLTNIIWPKVVKYGNKILASAPIAMLLTIAIFAYELNENEREAAAALEKQKVVTDNLKTIEQSLSTRHIGIFPDYLTEINKLLAETPLSTQDTSMVIIFEDVLFYGAFYNGVAFKEMIVQLAKLANENKKIMIAYYDNNRSSEGRERRDRMFREVIQESWMKQEDLISLAQERTALVQDPLYLNEVRARRRYATIDSIVCEKYFAIYRDEQRKVFSERRDKILIPFYDQTKNDNKLFLRLDNIKNAYLGKPEKDITFYDIYTMYYEFTEQLKLFFRQHNIETLPLNSYLSMSCWANGGKTLFAFPGRFAADEIGFISHDEHILNYIKTMLHGVLSQSKEKHEED